MSLTIERGLEAARQLTTRNSAQYNEAVRRYGVIIDAYRGEAPRALLLAHILRVNAQLYESPRFKDYRRGFMGASIEMAREADLKWDKIGTDPHACAYAYSRELNRVSYDLYTTYSNLFTTSGEDLWRCAYLRTTLGDTAFKIIWDMNTPTTLDDAVYPVLLYTVNDLQKSVVGWPINKLKPVVFRDCEFVFQLALSKGTLVSDGPGKEPVPPTDYVAQMFAG